MDQLISAALLALTVATPPAAGPSLHEVLSWTVSDERTVYVEDASGQWYGVDLVAPCDGLRTAFGIALEASPGNPFDRATGLFTGSQSCPIRSMTRIAVPPIPPEEPFGPAAGPNGP
ncbi:MAG: hypothetical protein QOC65_229 [Sphingomonadales bacterium]|nr:hypothetical protein [Sphingomonadales bacterium]